MEPHVSADRDSTHGATIALVIAAPHDDSYHMMLLGWVAGDIPAKVTHLEVKVVTLPLSTPLGHYLCFISAIQELLGIINNANLHRVARYQEDKKRGVGELLVFSNTAETKVLIEIRSTAGDDFHVYSSLRSKNTWPFGWHRTAEWQ
jgi:hypothetical protein